MISEVFIAASCIAVSSLCVVMGYMRGYQDAADKAQEMAEIAVSAEKLRCVNSKNKAPKQRCGSLGSMGIVTIPSAQLLWRKN